MKVSVVWINCWLFNNSCQPLWCLTSQKINWSWSSRLFVIAALCLPAQVGWSGTPDRNLSSSHLKESTLTLSIVLIQAGSKLNILAPFTPSDASLALLTLEWTCLCIGWGTTILPLLSLLENSKLYPWTNPWEIFHIKMTWYRSLRLSWEYMLRLANLSM